EARIKFGKLVLVGPDGKERYTITASERNNKISTGEYKVRVEGADGLVVDTTEFTLKKGDMVTVRVTVDPKSVAKKPEPENKAATERKAAEWVLSAGGTVTVMADGNETEISAGKDLPGGPLTLRTLLLND